MAHEDSSILDRRLCDGRLRALWNDVVEVNSMTSAWQPPPQNSNLTAGSLQALRRPEATTG